MTVFFFDLLLWIDFPIPIPIPSAYFLLIEKNHLNLNFLCPKFRPKFICLFPLTTNLFSFQSPFVNETSQKKVDHQSELFWREALLAVILVPTERSSCPME
eukprot:Sdes_comp13708_c0_seq1m3280